MNDLSSNITEQLFCSGFGQFQTDSKGKPLSSISWAEIQALVDSPQQVEKKQAQWLIPSTLLTRNLERQQAGGEYWVLWADIDDNPPILSKLADHLFEFWCDYEIYTSRSATSAKPKARILIPLEKPLTCSEWILAQECFNDHVDKVATTDKAALNPNQLLYLPNRGEFYDSISERQGGYFDPLTYFENEISAKRETIYREELATKQRLEKAEQTRAQRQEAGFQSPIDEFNSLYPIEQILLSNGYEQRGNKFNSPFSESKSFAGSVKDGRYHTLSTSDPLYSNGNGAVDAYGAFTVLSHNGNDKAALKDITQGNWLAIAGESWNKVKQREYAQSKETLACFDMLPSGGNSSTATAMPKFNLEQYVITDIAEMKAMLKNENWVLDKIALEGQITVFFAAPNSGKTLLTIHLLINAVKAGRVEGRNVYYLNCDDTLRGLTTKAELCAQFGIKMLSGGYNGFKNNQLISMLDAMARDDEAKGKILILDTLKKFSDLMNKTDSSAFNDAMRAFVGKGGTVIALAHVNKTRNADGKPIYQGTSDSVDDADCAYTIDVVNTVDDSFQGHKFTTKTILFENFKARGDNVNKVSYTYTKRDGGTYTDILDSVRLVDELEAEKAEKQGRIRAKLDEYAEEIKLVLEALDSGINTTQDIKNYLYNEGVSRTRARNVLKEHTGNSFSEGHRWQVEKGEKNARIYKRLF